MGKNTALKPAGSLALALLIWVSGTSVTVAQELSYRQALQIVWQQNPTLASARESLQTLTERVKASQGQYLPELNAQLSRRKSEQTRPSDSSLGVEDSASAGLELSQNLFAGLATKASIASTKADQFINQSDVQLTYALVGADFIKAYGAVYYGVETQKLSAEILERRHNNYELVKLRFEAGNENRGSLLVAQSSLDEATFDQDKSDFDLNVAKQRLKGLLGSEDELNLPVTPIPEGDISFPLPQGMDIEKEVQHHPTTQASRARIEKTEAGLTTARSQFFPKLGLSAGLNRNDQYFFPDRNESWNVALTLTIPLYKGGQNIHNYRAAQSELTRSRQQRDLTEFEQRNNMTAAIYNLKSSEQRLRVSKSSLDAARVRTEIARQKYNNGLLTFEDWSTIEDDYANRQKSYLEAQRTLLNAKADWMQALGENPFRELITYQKALP